MTASVGFQCPECVQAAASTSPVVQVRGGVIGTPSRPVVTLTLIIMNVVAYGLSGYDQVGTRMQFGGVTLYERGVLLGQCIRSDGQWYRLITGGFLHAGLLHLGMNMFALWIIGQALEPVLGRTRFGLLYLVSLIGGSAGVMLLAPNDPTIGASGAIFGLFGALLVIQLTRGINPLQSGIATLIGLNLIITFAIPGISIGGHIGGLITGGVAAGVLVAGKDLDGQASAERSARAVVVGFLGIGLLVLGLVLSKNADFLLPGSCP